MVSVLAAIGFASLLKTIVTFIIVLGLLIFFHELGHYLAAKGFGILVEEFALGFGPKIWSRQKGETLYSLRALPLGGFCKMPGENYDADFVEENETVKAAYEQGRCFNQKPAYQRFIVIAMGPIMNIFLAFMIFTLVFSIWGLPTDISQATIIADVAPGTPAALAGLRPADKIVAIENQTVNSWDEMSKLISENPEKQLVLKVQRREQLLTINITPKADEEGIGKIGILPTLVYERIPVFSAVKNGFIQTGFVTLEIFKGYIQIITRKMPAEIGGVVKVAQLVGEAAKVGLAYLFQFTAFISINLAIINLFPIPALDGGRLFFLLAEIIRGKPINPEKEGLVHYVGFIILLILMGIILVRDIVQIF